MRIRGNVLRKIVSVFSSVLLLVNSFSPYLLVTPVFNPVGAQEEITPTQEVTPTETVAEPTVEPTVAPTEEVTPSPTEEISPTIEASPTVEVTPVVTTEVTPEVVPTEIMSTVTPVQESTSTSNPLEVTNSPDPPTDQGLINQTPTVTPISTPNINGVVETNLVESYVCRADSLNGCLVTDKPDYAPTDVAIITGHGFAPDTGYTLRVTSSDEPAIDSSYSITTDANGSFTYSYQLDGTYRPNYQVQLMDLFGFVVASVTFTDTNWLCSFDAQGANDEPGQKDLTKMCRDLDSTDPVLITWNWDEESPGGNTGGNTGDACSLFDTDGDTFANYSMCVIVDGNPSVYQNKALYSCSDAKSDRCTNPIIISSGVTSSCGANVLAEDPFLGPPPGSDYPDDTVANCSINLSDVGGASSAVLIDVCSYPSQQPNSDPSDCIIATTANDKGTIQVIKDLYPSDDPGRFNLQIDGENMILNVGDGGDTGSLEFSAGAHTVGEIAYTGTNLSNYTSSISCANGQGSASGSGPLTITLDKNENIVCTITNTINTGTLQVLKNVDLNGDGDYTDTDETGATDWKWQANAGSDHNTGDTAITVNTGDYALTETAKTDFHQVDLSCTGGVLTGNSVAVSTGANVVCTFVNARDTGTIIVHKDVQGPAGEDVTDNSNSFEASLDGGTGELISDNISHTYINVPVGSHTITESLIDPDYTLYGISTAAGTAGNLTGLTITVATGTNDVYVTNRQKTGTIIVIKDVVDPDGGAISDSHSFTVNLSPGTQSSPLAEGTNAVFTVNPGTYTASETADPDYTSLGCLTPTGKTDIVVASGEEKTVTCKNQQKKAIITVVKDVTKSDGSAVDDSHLFHVTLNSETKDLAEGTSPQFTVNPGTYSAVEDVDGSYALVSNDGPKTVGSNGSATINIVNKQNPGTISGYKLEDADGDLTTTADQTPIQNWAIELWQNISTSWSKIADTLTDIFGKFSFTNLITGNYEVREVVPTGWTPLSPTGVPVTLGAGDESENNNFINFENVSITACKEADPDGNLATETGRTDVSGWQITLKKNNVVVGDTQVTGQNGCYTWTNLGPGDYSVDEEIRPSWASLNETTYDFGTVESGETYSHTFVNTQYGSIVVFKQTIPNGSSENFEFNASYHNENFLLTDGFADLSGNLLPGTYSVAELPEEGWDLTSATCDDESDPSSISLQAGEDVTCTFTNTQRGHIIVDKITNPRDSAQSFDFDATGSGYIDFSLTDGDTPNDQEVVPGNYSVSESVPTGWDQTSATCDKDETPDSLDVGAGETVTCTFTNTQRGSISGFKFEDASGDSTDNGDQTPVEGLLVELWQWVTDTFVDTGKTDTTDSNGFYEFLDLIPGVYQVREILSSLGAAWTNVTSTSVDVTVAPGESDKDNNFINTQYGTIIVEKQTVPDGDQTVFDFDLSYGDNDADLSDDQQDSSGNLLPGNYSVSENTPEGWVLTNTECTSSLRDTETAANLEVESGETITCVFTNSRKPTLTLVKTVINNNAGSAVANNFQGKINDGDVPWSTAQTLDPGSYTASESTLSNYTASVWGTNCNPDGTITLAYGDNRTCSITNDDNAPALHLRKTITTDNGGTDAESDWTLTAVGTGDTPTNLSGSTPVDSGSGFKADTYTLAESAGPSGYMAGKWSCGEATMTDPTHVVVPFGSDVTCTINNNDDVPSLTLNKIIVNNNGGTAEENDWTLTATGPTSISGPGATGDSDVVSDSTFDAGTYTLSESTGPTGYTASSWVCEGGSQSEDEITIDLGENVTCTITNDDQTGRLIVKKILINDDGGLASEDDFSYKINGGSSVFFEADGQNESSVNSGDYTIVEDSFSGYDTSYENCDDVFVPNGGSATCTITNDDIAPTITLIKEVIGGTAEVGDFSLYLGGSSVTSGDVNSVLANFSYDIDEDGPTGYTFTSITGDTECPELLREDFEVELGKNITCTITNTRDTGTLQVLKNVDLNGDGDYEDEDETGSTDWEWQYDDGSDQNTGDDQITLNTGNYDLTETVKDGFTQLDLTCEGGDLEGNTITVTKDADVVCTFENKRDTGTIIVRKIIDADGDLETIDDQSPASNWQFTVAGETNPAPDSTDSLGIVNFNLLKTGGYNVTENIKDGFDLLDAYCDSRENGSPEGETIYEVDVSADNTVNCTFINTPNGKIHGQKWNDLDGDGLKNGEEEYLSGWKIFIDENDNQTWDDGEKFMLTDDDQEFGWYWFEHLLPGTYNICEVPQGGWQQTYPNPSCHAIDVNVPGETNTCTASRETNSNDGAGYRCDFGNQQVNPTLQISKSNNGVDNSQGGTVVYTLKIKALENKVLGVVVKDLLPRGFRFQHVISIIRNGLDDITAQVGDPAYHSPGTYSLGDLEADDEIVIKYQAEIDGSQELGLYKDIAWASGTSASDDRVLAMAQPDGFVDDNFVGTAVRVNGNFTEGGTISGGEVLGASTQLPATGGDQIWLMIAGILSFVGLIIMLFGTMIKKWKTVLVVLLFVMGYWLLGAIPVNAATNLSIRVSEPKTPTSTTDFKIVFTVLDLSESASSITARCYYKKNLGDSWTQYDSDKNILAGGNTDYCQVNSSFFNESEHTYFFKATATNGVDFDDSELQGLVAVGYDDRAPSTPTNYRKERNNLCQNIISFKTADDSQTSRVEIYRSESTSFNLDQSTRLTSIGIGPNSEGSYTDTLPDCDKTYYYVIRSFNNAGNASAATGDSVNVTTSTATTTEGGAIVVENSNLPGGTGSVLGETTGEGEVKGIDVSVTPTGKPEIIDVKDKSQGMVKGISDFVAKKTKLSLLIVILVLGLGYGVYYFLKKRNQSV